MSLLNRALGMGRMLAEARMTETVTVGVYQDGTDAATGEPTRVLVEQHYAGPGRIKYPSLGVTPANSPSLDAAAQVPYLSVTSDEATIQVGDEVHVTASTADSSLVGRTFKVEGRPQSGQTTSHRFPLIQLS